MVGEVKAYVSVRGALFKSRKDAVADDLLFMVEEFCDQACIQCTFDSSTADILANRWSQAIKILNQMEPEGENT